MGQKHILGNLDNLLRKKKNNNNNNNNFYGYKIVSSDKALYKIIKKILSITDMTGCPSENSSSREVYRPLFYDRRRKKKKNNNRIIKTIIIKIWNYYNVITAQ
jgi:hypothetical protein